LTSADGRPLRGLHRHALPNSCGSTLFAGDQYKSTFPFQDGTLLPPPRPPTSPQAKRRIHWPRATSPAPPATTTSPAANAATEPHWRACTKSTVVWLATPTTHRQLITGATWARPGVHGAALFECLGAERIEQRSLLRRHSNPDFQNWQLAPTTRSDTLAFGRGRRANPTSTTIERDHVMGYAHGYMIPPSAKLSRRCGGRRPAVGVDPFSIRNWLTIPEGATPGWPIFVSARRKLPKPRRTKRGRRRPGEREIFSCELDIIEYRWEAI
jgi:hypothetical protein